MGGLRGGETSTVDTRVPTFSSDPAWPDSGRAPVSGPPFDEGAKRYFIVSAGRTGSSLLAAILADAGADFALDAPADWDRNAGEMEHRELFHANRLIQSAYALSARKPGWGVARLRWVIARSLGKRRLHKLLNTARFFKVADAHWTIRTAFKLGYFPVVLLNFRRFEDYAVSLGLMWDMSTVEMLAEQYVMHLTRGLQLLNTFGGCAVGYESLVGAQVQSWVEPLSFLTGLPVHRLTGARERRVSDVSPPVIGSLGHPRIERLYDTLCTINGRVIPPSAQALRIWSGGQSLRGTS
jgi:hypothetical protein